MNYLDLELMKQDYEAHVRWLQSLYGSKAESTQPGRTSRMAKRLLVVVGRTLVSLGERMQLHYDMPASSPVTK
jgi:hypothetical protein